MVKFYWKTVVGTAALTTLVLAELGLIRGVNPDWYEMRIFGVGIVGLTAFVIINEKLSTREKWNENMVLLLGIIIALSTFLLLVVVE